MRHSKRYPSSAGFTLIELMVVVAVIGLLATIAITRFDSVRTRSRQAEVKVNLQALYMAQQSYYAANNTYTSNLAVLAYSPERGNRYAYYLDLPPTSMQMRNTPKTTLVSGMDAVSVDTFEYPKLGSSPGAFATDGTLTFGSNAGKLVIPAGSLTYLQTGSAGAFLARAYGLINPSSTVTNDSWFISSNGATVTSACRACNQGKVPAGSPGCTYSQADCI